MTSPKKTIGEHAQQTSESFEWKVQPEAQSLIRELTGDFLDRCPGATTLADRMLNDTGTRFIDWIDHIHAPHADGIDHRLINVGFALTPREGAKECYVHAGGIFPAVLLEKSEITRLAIKVESVADFAAAWQICPDHKIIGGPWSNLRRVLGFKGDKTELWAVERHGYNGYSVPKSDPARSIRMMGHLETLRRRRRKFHTDHEGFACTHQLVKEIIDDVGVNAACDLFFSAERDYWMRRNRAGRVQKARQDRLGLGWANHDHHTYRSSRSCYPDLIAVLELLGFHCRERFYAGAEAGWGAQVLEQSVTGITIFSDVDMSPNEVQGDFAHHGFKPKDDLGTVGMWCALHGEAILQAGMHHLECQFDWQALKDQLQDEAGITTMDPFTTFAYLRQAFTEGEMWPVDEKRIERLLEAGHITPQQADTFRRKGALGSHLENLERNEGYKGFNQQGVSAIISKTDPRRHAAPSTVETVGA